MKELTNENEKLSNEKIELLKRQLKELEKKLTIKEIEIEEIKNNPDTIENIDYHIEEKEAIEKQVQNVKHQINKLIEEEKNKIRLINCQNLLKQLNDIKDSIKINYEMIEKINQKNNNKQKQEIDKTIQLEIKQLLKILEETENTIDEYQKKIKDLKNNKNNCDKENKGIEFYQNLINAKNNEILKIHERINLLKNTKNCNQEKNNCCKEIKEKLAQLVTNENDKMIKIDEIYQWQKKIKENEISNQINNIDKIIENLKKDKNNIIPKEIKEKISKIEDINNKMLNNNHQICLLETELKQDPNNEKIKNKIKNKTRTWTTTRKSKKRKKR
ncbi:MAG: hypothetical protein PPFGHCPK_00785 [Spiroplasma endosymbiont of Drosophila atripex]|nr:MAG: hypothetical protein PPFGHCPK_00785 [Spiroplasma endosymbiont of Drosophila atripex]